DPQLRERRQKCPGMVCGPEPIRYHVRRTLQCVTVSETRMGRPRYTEFMTLPQVRLLRDPAGDPVLQGGQLAMPATIALGLRHKAPGRFHQLDHVVDEFDQDPEPRCR